MVLLMLTLGCVALVVYLGVVVEYLRLVETVRASLVEHTLGRDAIASRLPGVPANFGVLVKYLRYWRIFAKRL